MSRYLVLLICSVAAYMIGGVNGAIVASKLIYHKDIRDYGSGNAGLTNFYRVFGRSGALIVLLIDIGKTVLTVLISGWICGEIGWDVTTAKLVVGFCTMLGHAFPAIYKFKGGKAVLTAGTLLFLIDWRVALICWGIFALMLLLTRYVSLGSVLAGLALPIAVALFGYTFPQVLLSALCGALLILRHAENIGRLMRGEETKFKF